MLPYSYRFMSLREACKSIVIKKTHELRLAYRILAQKLCQNGRLPEPELIFHLSHYEIGQLVEVRNPTLIQK
jgi:hypothetical protein